MRRTGEKKTCFIGTGARRGSGKRFAECLVLLLALSQVEAARGVTVRAQLERTQIPLGDSVGLQIIVSDSAGGTISPRIPEVDGVTIQYTGSGMQLVNLRRSDIRNYVVTPSREGSFVIPPIPVRVDGEAFQTDQLLLTVRRASETESSMRLTALVSKKECYVLESVDVTFQWYISSDISEYQLSIPLLRDKDELSLKLMSPPPPVQEIVASNYEVRAGRSSEVVDGTQYAVRSITLRIFPPNPGTYTIRPATVTAMVQSGYRVATDFFGRRRVPNYERAFAASDAIELVVKDLPAEGKPAGFAGAVGKYSISVMTADIRIKVGDPMTLKISISGRGLLEKMKRPSLSGEPAFANDFLISESLAPGDVSGDTIVFEQTIRAKSEDVKEIPSIALAYFNADREVYEVARSKPIPITVLPTTEVTAKDVVKFGPSVLSGPTTRPEEVPGGILANYNHLDALHDQAVRWSLLSFLGLPPVTYFIVLAFVSRRRKLAGDVALARSKSARKLFKKYLVEAAKHLPGDDRQFYDSLARGISRFTSDKLNLGTGELTAYDVAVLAEENKIKPEISRNLSDILVECDAGRFAPSARSAEDRRQLLRRAEELARTLGKRL